MKQHDWGKLLWKNKRSKEIPGVISINLEITAVMQIIIINYKNYESSI